VDEISTERRLAQNVRARRTEIGLSQQRLAAVMVAAGCAGWTASTVANVERLDKPRAVSVDELAALCVGLRCSLEDLLAGMPEISDRMRGRSKEAEGTSWSVQVTVAQLDEIRHDLEERLAKSLGVHADDVQRIALDLFERDVLAERDARMREETPDNALSRAKYLGHITRNIRADMKTYLDELTMENDQR
jgi:transcriptional regulator with XRE-family HTH domain